MNASAALSEEIRDRPFAYDVLSGLSRRSKRIPSKWLYDHRGSQLFEEITQLDEYYPSRTEIQLLERSAAEIAADVGPGATLVELGSGSGRKTPILLGALQRPRAYVPIDICERFLDEAVAALRARFPAVAMRPIVGDFTDPNTLPPLGDGDGGRARRVGFFPGSTIGNFTTEEAIALLSQLGGWLGRGSMLVVGADATHDPAVLLPAYDDAHGVTAAFNRNLLERINRELDGDFDVRTFRHEARFHAEQHRVEMHLVSTRAQRVRVLGGTFHFAAGESIHTENSHKYSLMRFQALAARAGWAERQCWMDAHSRFAVHVLERCAR